MTRTAVIAGAGGSLGAETCRALRQRGWRVIGVGRDAARLASELKDGVDDIVAVDLASPEEVESALRRIEDVDALVYNAGKIDLAPLLETTPEVFAASWQTNAFGAFVCARTLAGGMIQRARGSMIFIGATASTRGGARTHAFASAKHALRGLAASLAKELGPRGVHVAHVVIDGKVWGARTRARFPDAREDQCLEPSAVAATILGLIEQPPSAWTFEMDLRPAGERWS
jgi:NAD(P)-dependent dehydrogenase (short-subunit alcohol dehydrogenase family)